MLVDTSGMTIENKITYDGRTTAIRYHYPVDISIPKKTTVKISLSPFLKCLGNIAAKDKIQLDLVLEKSCMDISVLSASTNIFEVQTVPFSFMSNHDLLPFASFVGYYPPQTVPLARTTSIAKKKGLSHDSRIPFYGCDKFLCFSTGNSIFRISDCDITEPGDVFELDSEGNATLVTEMYHLNILAKHLKCFSSISSIGGASTKMHFYVPKDNSSPLMCVAYLPSEGKENCSVYLAFG